MAVDSSISVTELYQQRLADKGYKADEAQLTGIAALQRCQDEWRSYKGQRSNALTKMLRYPALPKGVYLYGGVGRGKSFIMDCFFDALPLERKTRLHFHEFMREVHRQLHALKGTADPLDVLAKRMSRKHRLICFDEFHISDITDAMMLYKLLDAMFRNRMSIVTTSNFHPDGLYPNGLHRDRILPAIELIKQQFEVVNVDAGTDYRRRTLESAQIYLHPLGAETDGRMHALFDQLISGPDENPVLDIEQRELKAQRVSGAVAWFDFHTLCGTPRSKSDYLELATRYHTIFLSDVPVMPVKMASEARRFTWLVDVFYDRKVKLVISAEAAPEALYVEGPLAHEFPRTVSRLNEMQSKEYLAEEKRDVDTALTD